MEIVTIWLDVMDDGASECESTPQDYLECDLDAVEQALDRKLEPDVD